MKPENFAIESLKELRKAPVTEGMNSREIVRRAIEFADPPRIPYYFLYHPSATDLVFVGPMSATAAKRKGKTGNKYTDHWGVTWEVTGRWWDHAVGHPLKNLNGLASYRFPDVSSGVRQMAWFAKLAKRSGKYVIGYNTVLMYETMRSLMGFEELMMAPYTQPDGLRRLLERLTDLTVEVVETYAQIGAVDGFETVEDWGLQTSLQMKIDTFREFYKPFYKRIVDTCHKHKMHFFWHNCGYITDMFPDMIEIGVDVLQLDQPRLMGHQKLIDLLGGKICMWNPVDIQWCTSMAVTEDDIRREVADMMKIYDVRGHRGGYIAKHYPQPWDIDLPVARQKLIYDAFMENGCRSLQ